MTLGAVCVFAGSRPGADPAYAEAAAALGTAIARRGLGMVYGGASVGLMGVAADAALAAGGEVVGVIPRDLGPRERAHPRLSELVVVETMHERKALMAARADAFAALPGGVGTLDELVEVLTWTGLRIHDKPVGVLDVAGYWAPLAALLDHAVARGFLRREHRAALLSATDPHALLDALAAWRPSPVDAAAGHAPPP